MTPDFNDFLSYASEHIPEMQYDTSQKLRAETGFTLSQADIEVVTQISFQMACSLLRQYHAWLLSK